MYTSKKSFFILSKDNFFMIFFFSLLEKKNKCEKHIAKIIVIKLMDIF